MTILILGSSIFDIMVTGGFHPPVTTCISQKVYLLSKKLELEKTGKMYYQFFHSCFIKSTNISKNVLTSDFQQNYASSNKTKENMNMRK